MPSVVCPSCRRNCRVRQQSLGRAVVCPHCAKSFTPDRTEPDLPRPDPQPYDSYGPEGWHVLGGLFLLLTLAFIAVWLLTRRS